MDVLVVDLTHGGVKIAVEMEKLVIFTNVYVYDVYHTLKNNDKQLFEAHNIKILASLDNFREFVANNEFFTDLIDKNLILVNPIHSSFNITNFDSYYSKNLNHSNNFNNFNNANNNVKIEDDVNLKYKLDLKDKIKVKNELTINELDINESNIIGLNINEITHHQAVNLILNEWKERTLNDDLPVIEVTGVKGKTSVVAMLKEILLNRNPLVLSSLGACYYKNGKKIILKKNISITPANILETIDLAKKADNADCNYVAFKESSNNNNNNANNNRSNRGSKNEGSKWNQYDISYDSCIFESSLGVTGLGDVGVLTNIVENYPIAKNTSNAKNAKKQVFNCEIVVIEEETLIKHYSKQKTEFKDKINTFSLKNHEDKSDGLDYDKADLIANEVKYGLNSTIINIKYNNIKTKSGKIVEGSFNVETFAPGKHHVLNVLATITAALSLNIDEKIIKKGLKNFNGIVGRTSLKHEDNLVIIEEINPGINTKAIESSIKMINNLNKYVVILGGKYGITCEEIDENKVANLLDNYLDMYLHNVIINLSNKNEFYLILTDDLGKNIKEKMRNTAEFVQDPMEAQKIAIFNDKNILFIYRSNYSQVNKR